MKKGYVWSSEILAYAVCPIKFKLKYMDKIEMPPTTEMVLSPVNFWVVEYTQIAEKRPVLIDDETRKKVGEIRDRILSETIEEKKPASCFSCEYKEVCG